MIRKQTLNKILIFLTSFFALFSWWSAQNLLETGASVSWLMVGIGLSLVLIFGSLVMILARSAATAELVVFCALAASIPFAFQISHLIAVAVASLFALMAVRRIRRDLELNIQIDLWKSLRMGKGFLLAAFALVLASQYYVVALVGEGEKDIPKFELGSVGGTAAMRFLASFNPSFAALQNEQITVDEFILQSWENQKQQFAGEADSLSQTFVEQQLDKNEIPIEQREQLRIQAQEKLMQMREGVTQDNENLVLQEGRKQFSEMVGYVVRGDEKMADIFSGIIDRKLNTFFAPDPEVPERAKALPLIISILLFFSVLSVASLIWWLLAAVVVGLFRLLVKMEIVKIGKVTVTAEIIE